MEIFLDGGWFEIVIAFFLGITLNFIFFRKYLLIIFSLIILAGPVFLFFVKNSELFNWFVIMSIFNSVLLVWLLWKTKKDHPQDRLFNVDPIKSKLIKARNRVNAIFHKT